MYGTPFPHAYDAVPLQYGTPCPSCREAVRFMAQNPGDATGYEELEYRGDTVLQRRRGSGGNVRLSHLLLGLLYYIPFRFVTSDNVK